MCDVAAMPTNPLDREDAPTGASPKTDDAPDPRSAVAFDRLLGTLDYPMFIVTARRDDERSGCLIGFASQVSIRPARFLVCLSDKNRTYRIARECRRLAVHFVPAHEEALARLFGGETGDRVDKFSACAWHDGPHGLPILDACENWFVGTIVEQLPMGDHVGFLLEPDHTHHGAPEGQFTFHRARRIDAGHDA
jgi:flavin reductase (DIM6/NTAB) family NADH-FMN oxidoreductase RutF